MANLTRRSWEINILQKIVNGEKRYTVITNTFIIDDLKEEEFNYITHPFIGPGMRIDIRCVPYGTKIEDADKLDGPDAQEKERLISLLDKCFRDQRRAVGYLAPSMQHLISYFYNACSDKQYYDIDAIKDYMHAGRILFCGAGPSLKAHKDKIAKIIKSRTSLVVAGGTAIETFHRLGLKPHLAIALDPFDTEVTRLDSIPLEWTADIPLIASASLNPFFMEKWQGPIIRMKGINCNDMGVFVENLDARPPGEGKTGVTTWMPAIAKLIGAAEINYIGVDLQYFDDGSRYGEGLTHQHDKYVPDTEVGGKDSAWHWENELFDLSHIPEQFEGIRFINRSPTGAKLKNWEHRPFDELMNKRVKQGSIPLVVDNPKNRAHRINQLKELADSLVLWVDKVNKPDFKKSTAFKYFISPYHAIMDYKMWRTGDFEHSTLRDVMRTNADIIYKAVRGDIYGGEHSYLRRNTRTIGKHKAEEQAAAKDRGEDAS